jgi:hypothetical protein
MKEMYSQIQEKRALLRELYRFPRSKAVKDRIRIESRLLGELEHHLTLCLASPVGSYPPVNASPSSTYISK